MKKVDLDPERVLIGGQKADALPWVKRLRKRNRKQKIKKRKQKSEIMNTFLKIEHFMKNDR